jgi:hypothetical protein
LHGEKENFEEYSLFLESAKLSFAIGKEVANLPPNYGIEVVELQSIF